MHTETNSLNLNNVHTRYVPDICWFYSIISSKFWHKHAYNVDQKDEIYLQEKIKTLHMI